jgi:hypothetical protein
MDIGQGPLPVQGFPQKCSHVIERVIDPGIEMEEDAIPL